LERVWRSSQACFRNMGIRGMRKKAVLT
jgi:hypothetical protein